MSTLFGFEELEVWKKARQLKLEIGNIVKSFPGVERYRLTDSIVRSSRSFSALVAEGHGRFSFPDQIHYCIQACGSLAETINHLIDAFDEGYITTEQMIALKNIGKQIERLINGYITFLRKQKPHPRQLREF